MAQKWDRNKIIHVDAEGDRERASDGYSRYGSYVGAREMNFVESYTTPPEPLEPIAFAINAWRIAASPIMSPGLVQWRPDLHSVALGYDVDGRDLVVTAELPVCHRQLAADLPYTWGDWKRERHWESGDYEYAAPPAARRGQPAVTAMVTIQHILAITLVTPGKPTGRALVDDCRQSVELTAAAINAELPEIISNVLGEKQ